MSTQQLEVNEVLSDGSSVTIRPLNEGDMEIERDFIMRLSPQSRRFRFLYTIVSPSDQLLKRLTDLDETTQTAFVALSGSGVKDEIGVARMSTLGDGRAEFAVVVRDDWQHKGLGTLLTQRIIAAARSRGVRTLFSIDASDNYAMHEFSKNLGFRCARNPEDAAEVIHTLQLNESRM
jgi:N-acetylglutamate synthase-like GNAT family acetyltransferase